MMDMFWFMSERLNLFVNSERFYAYAIGVVMLSS